MTEYWTVEQPNEEAFKNGCDWARSQILEFITRRIQARRDEGALEECCVMLQRIRQEIKGLKLYEG